MNITHCYIDVNKVFTIIIAVNIMVLMPTTAFTEQDKSWYYAKQVIADIHREIGYMKTLYCGCPYKHHNKQDPGGKLDGQACGTTSPVMEDDKLSSTLHWEHVVPASWFGNKRTCWTEGHKRCKEKGRDCCLKVNPSYREQNNDPHNLFPSSGSINKARLNHPYGNVPGENREYGECNFEVGKNKNSKKIAEPACYIRGEVARAMLYMRDTYRTDVKMSHEILREWDEKDPPQQWEIQRAKFIQEETGKENRHIIKWERNRTSTDDGQNCTDN